MAISKVASLPATAANKGPDCTVCRALIELPKADADALVQMLSDKSLRYTELADRIYHDPEDDTPQWVRNINHRTYARHATGGCAARVFLR